MRSPTIPRPATRALASAGVLAALLAPAPHALASAPDPAPLDAAALASRVAALESELAALRQLAERLQEMEAKEAERTRRQEVLTTEVRELREDRELPRTPELVPQHGMGPAASKVYGVERGFSIGGYGQGWYTRRTGDRQVGRDSFDWTRFVLYTGYKFSDRLVMNAELEWEHATSGTGSVSAEFAQIDWLLSEGANLRAGLLLAPIGFVNEMHEPPTYFGNERPEVERRIIPSTWRENGFGIFGEPRPGLTYRAYLMNGLRASKFTSAGIRPGRQQGSEAHANDWSLALRADLEVSPRLTVGASMYSGAQGQGEAVKVTAGGATATPDADLTLVEAHAQYRHRGWRLRALAARSRLSDADVLSAAQAVSGKGPVGERMHGAYGEVAYDLTRILDPDSDRQLNLFFRYESLDTQARVPAGFARDASQDLLVRTLGLEYRPHPDVVLKLDHRDFSLGAGVRPDEINLGVGWMF